MAPAPPNDDARLTEAATVSSAETGKTAKVIETASQGTPAGEPTSPSTDAPAESTGTETESQPAELETLRRLLMAPERSALTDLRHRLDTPEVRTREMAHYLPEAIHLRSGADERLGRALQPTVEQALRQSVRRDPRQIVDAIFPVMGPAIRRAIVSTLMGMLQSFNKVIDHTFTLRGIKWRLEALTTGRSFAEVVLLHTLVYQVEQVFLIHRTTGLVLEHAVPTDALAQDPDLISSMLTAIQDFVRDSFATHAEESLNTLRMGADRSIWIEQSAQVSVAAVIRGTPPVDLRTQLREILESIQITHAAQIESFEGDSQGFADLRPRLDACLQARFQAEERRLAPLTIALLILLAGALIGGGLWLRNRGQRWEAFIAHLNRQTGVVVTRVEKTGGVRHIFGLRDPMAVAPQSLLADTGLPADKVVWHWRAYHDLAPELVMGRIRKRLKPPASVTLQLEGERLEMKGFARHRWLRAARQLSAGLLSVAEVDMQAVKDIDLIQARSDAERLAVKTLYFTLGSFEIDADGDLILSDVVATITRLIALSRETGIAIRVTILGHTDESGSRTQNLALAQKRADVVREHLIRQGVPPHRLQAVGISSHAATAATTETNEALLRSVTFHAVING